MLGFLFKTSQDSEKSFTSELDTANFRIVQLEKKINELTFTLDALWELIAGQSSFDSNALQEKISAKKMHWKPAPMRQSTVPLATEPFLPIKIPVITVAPNSTEAIKCA